MLKKIIILSSLLTFNLSANAALIDFRTAGIGFGNLGESQVVLPEATFTSSDGLFNINTLGLCAFDTLQSNCEKDMNVSFAGEVNGLTFNSFGHDQGDQVTVDVFGLSGLLGSVIFSANQVVDLTGFFNVTSLDLRYTGINGSAGYAYNLFSFEASPVPEPASLALLSLGLLGLVISRRKRIPTPINI